MIVTDHVDPVWGWADFPPIWESRWDIICYTWPTKPDPRDCAGEGKCHGCLCWCDFCGDVTDVCDAEWPERCDQHKRYPEMPERLKPNPNQLFLPGFDGVDPGA